MACHHRPRSLAFVVGTALCLASALCSPSYGGVRIPIGAAASDQISPAIHGDIIVWEDYRNDADDTNADIYGFDLDNAVELPICTAPGHQWLPSVWGDTVVWMDRRNAQGTARADIYGCTVSTSSEFPVCVNDRDKWSPDVYGGRVAWEENMGGGDWDIWTTELGQTPVCVCSATGAQTDAAVWGNNIVWHDEREAGNLDIYRYDLASSQEHLVCDAAKDQSYADIYDTRIVWEDYRNPSTGPDIHLYDIATGLHKPICTAPGAQWEPAIWGDYFVWGDKRSGDWDVYAYDLARQIETPLVVAPGDQRFPRIFENKVVYQDGASGYETVFLTFIEPDSYQAVGTPSAARSLQDGTTVGLTGCVVTGSYGGKFYVERPDRTSGIRVKWPLELAEGSVVSVFGRIGTKNGERCIEAFRVEIDGSAAVPAPLGMTNLALGGGSPDALTPGITGGMGVHSLGLLVRTTGIVTSADDHSFTISDGSVADGVVVLCGSIGKPAVGDFVSVRGAATTVAEGERIRRAVLVDDESDVVSHVGSHAAD